MTSPLKPIGVIGGMGPAATAAFMQRIIDLTDAKDDADHVPLLVDMNPQIPSRISAIMEGTENPGPTLARMAKSLEASDAKALAMPCNTAHFYANDITCSVDIPLLNMLSLSAETIKSKLGSGTVGMLASPLTDDIHVFRNSFAPFGLDVIFPKDADHVLSIIRAIKAKGINSDMSGQLSELGTELKANGADSILVGCSEFSLLSKTIVTALPVHDTVDILAGEVIRFSGANLKGA